MMHSSNLHVKAIEESLRLDFALADGAALTVMEPVFTFHKYDGKLSMIKKLIIKMVFRFVAQHVKYSSCIILFTLDLDDLKYTFDSYPVNNYRLGVSHF